jgi:hypothetical protein
MNGLERSHWSDAAKGGGAIGLIVVAVSLLQWRLGRGAEPSGNAMTLGVVYYFAVIFAIGFFARSRAQKYGDEGFGYPQALGYIVSMMIFAGFVVGVGQFILYNYIDPDLPGREIDSLFSMIKIPAGMEQQMDAAKTVAGNLMKNPLVTVFGAVIGETLRGLLIGLIIAAFVRTQPNRMVQ